MWHIQIASVLGVNIMYACMQDCMHVCSGWISMDKIHTHTHTQIQYVFARRYFNIILFFSLFMLYVHLILWIKCNIGIQFRIIYMYT